MAQKLRETAPPIEWKSGCNKVTAVQFYFVASCRGERIMAKWFCLIDGKQLGPFEPAELKQLADAGTLSLCYKVRREDMARWHEASEVKGLFQLARSHAVPTHGAGGATKLPPTAPAARKKSPAMISAAPLPVVTVSNRNHPIIPYLHHAKTKNQREWGGQRKSCSQYVWRLRFQCLGFSYGLSRSATRGRQ